MAEVLSAPCVHAWGLLKTYFTSQSLERVAKVAFKASQEPNESVERDVFRAAKYPAEKRLGICRHDAQSIANFLRLLAHDISTAQLSDAALISRRITKYLSRLVAMDNDDREMVEAIARAASALGEGSTTERFELSGVCGQLEDINGTRHATAVVPRPVVDAHCGRLFVVSGGECGIAL